ncbi:MAG: hypothetical protein JNL98_04545 [Bryobacterales bacterium]|nr:hypothetical protein [Bryobacterales bacterium]
METVQVPEQSSSISNYYLWEAPGKNTSIHLDYRVVDRLLVEVMRGFGAIPRRGAEVGGILLGSVESGPGLVIRIDDFEPVVCEHRRGPSYLLSDADLAHYEEALLRHKYSPEKAVYAVGCYRSHTREGLSLSPEDLQHFDKYFPDLANAFLLVKPFATRVSVAGFFFREEDGSVHAEAPYHEFPFRRRELGGGATPPLRNRDSGASMPDPQPQRSPSAPPVFSNTPIPESPSGRTESFAYDPEPAAPPPPRPHVDDFPADSEEMESPVERFRKRNVWIPLSFVFLLLGVLVGMQLALSYRPAKTASMFNDAFRLSLGVSRAGSDLHVRWDRASIAVKNGQRGVLTIEDGTFRGTVDLDALQLQNPNVYYRHITSTVRFRLEVFIKDNSMVVETLEWRQ